MLSKLAVHYYRPDFNEGQARSLIADMVQDLSEFSVGEIEAAIAAYRQAPPPPGKQKYFPDSGALRQLAAAERRHRQEVSERAPLCNFDSRPCAWWYQPKNRWKPHWREEDIPDDKREAYDRWIAAKSRRVA